VPGAPLRERIDTFQQRHIALSFPYAVHKRFTEDRGKHYASLISYYGFFSLFPRWNRLSVFWPIRNAIDFASVIRLRLGCGVDIGLLR